MERFSEFHEHFTQRLISPLIDSDEKKKTLITLAKRRPHISNRQIL